MKKFDLPLFSDTVFTFLSCLLFMFALFRYKRLSLLLSTLLSTAIALLVGLLSFWGMYFHRKSKFLLQQDKENLKKLELHLTLCPKEALPPVAELFNSNCPFYAFTMQPLSADVVAQIIKETSGKPFTLFCNSLSKEAKELCDLFCVEVVESKKIYIALQKSQKLPSAYICGTPKRLSLPLKIKGMFLRKNAVKFFWSGTGILLLSLITPYSLYYVIFGGGSLLLALGLRLFGDLQH